MMMRRIFLILSLVMMWSLPGFSQQATPQKPPEQPQAEEPPVLTVPKTYRYNARGRRDPFVNPIPTRIVDNPVKPPAPPRPPGLRGVLVNEAVVAGVVTSKEPSMNVVIIAAPGAKTPYFARVGDQLYDAIVKNISFENVTFTLTSRQADNPTAREIVRQVRPNAGEKK